MGMREISLVVDEVLFAGARQQVVDQGRQVADVHNAVLVDVG